MVVWVFPCALGKVVWASWRAWCIWSWGVSCLGARRLWQRMRVLGKGEDLRVSSQDFLWETQKKGRKGRYSIQQVGGHLYTQKQSRGIRHVLSCCLSPKVLILEKKEASKIKISKQIKTCVSRLIPSPIPQTGNYSGNWTVLGHAYLCACRHPQREHPSHWQLNPTIQLLEKVSVSQGKRYK